ncbi:MAG: CGNR zinc finger domain-containing protein [Nocardioides sp.]
MPFTHDTEASLRAAATLANSGLEPDTLQTIEDLDAFYSEFEFTGRRDGDAAELAAVQAIRADLYALLTASRDDAVALVNQMLASAGAVPQLVRHDVWDWHLHAVEPERDLPTRITVEAAMAMIDVIRADETSRLGVCADDECRGVVVDLSRNRSKRFCSTTCGNRNAVAAYRARRRD